MMARFCRYVEKVYALSGRVAQLTDSRQQPQIDTGVIFLSAMMMCVTRQRSLNAMEGECRVPGRWEKILGSRKPSADTLGRVVDLMDSEALRDMLSEINHQLRRNKALDENPWPMRFVAFDGHEFFSQ
jgi:hypothetical protein